MKGPGGRLKFDARREWLCPACQLREKTGGDIVTRRCPCCQAAEPPRLVWMAVEEPRGSVAAEPAPLVEKPA